MFKGYLRVASSVGTSNQSRNYLFQIKCRVTIYLGVLPSSKYCESILFDAGQQEVWC